VLKLYVWLYIHDIWAHCDGCARHQAALHASWPFPAQLSAVPGWSVLLRHDQHRQDRSGPGEWLLLWQWCGQVPQWYHLLPQLHHQTVRHGHSWELYMFLFIYYYFSRFQALLIVGNKPYYLWILQVCIVRMYVALRVVNGMILLCCCEFLRYL